MSKFGYCLNLLVGGVIRPYEIRTDRLGGRAIRTAQAHRPCCLRACSTRRSDPLNRSYSDYRGPLFQSTLESGARLPLECHRCSLYSACWMVDHHPTAASRVRRHVSLARDRLAGCSAMLAHHIECFFPAHAGKTARKSNSPAQRRAVHFKNCHRVHSRPPGERLTLSTCLLFSRPASACARCWSLLFLSIHTGAKGLHQVDDPRRSKFPSWFDLLASLFLLQ